MEATGAARHTRRRFIRGFNVLDGTDRQIRGGNILFTPPQTGSRYHNDYPVVLRIKVTTSHRRQRLRTTYPWLRGDRGNSLREDEFISSMMYEATIYFDRET